MFPRGGKVGLFFAAVLSATNTAPATIVPPPTHPNAVIRSPIIPNAHAAPHSGVVLIKTCASAASTCACASVCSHEHAKPGPMAKKTTRPHVTGLSRHGKGSRAMGTFPWPCENRPRLNPMCSDPPRKKRSSNAHHVAYAKHIKTFRQMTSGATCDEQNTASVYL